METIAQIAKKARYNHRLPISLAAKLLCISPSHLHAIESGKKKRPKMEVLYKIAWCYGLDVDEVCLSAERIPQDIFYTILRRPELISLIRSGAI